ncbi:MAG: hypothetical protein HKN43_16090 [Rhodothermales bacterium]|nr:hypothetical protein [Rhodothermales bacterium]
MEHRFYRLTFLVLIAALNTGCRSSEKALVPPIDVVSETSASPVISPHFAGNWLLDAQRSTAIDPWRGLSLELSISENLLTIQRKWRGSREGGTTVDSSVVQVNGPPASAVLEQWPDNRHLGAYITGDRSKTIRAFTLDRGRTIGTESFLTVSVQQGEKQLRIYTEYRLSVDNDRIDLIELRSTRPTPTHYVFRREVSQ